jgi:hypothetical protein
MKQNRNSIKIAYGILSLIAVGVFALPTASADSIDGSEMGFTDIYYAIMEFDLTDLFSAEAADPKTHYVTMAAQELPNGQLAYKMVEHLIDDQDVTEQRYGANPTPSIPGPVLVIDEEDAVILTLENELGEGCVSVHVHGVHYGIESDGTLESVNGKIDSCAAPDEPYTYTWNAAKGSGGTWPYHDHTFGGELGSEDKGLFGAIIVNEKKTQALIDGKIRNIQTSSISKDYVLYMVETTFWGVEIDNKNGGLQTPLWTNPNLVAKQNDNVRFHVLGLGTAFHSFHMHAHKWVDNGSTNIVDTQTIAPLTREVFTVKAGEGVGTGDWMYHCHVFAHMQAGMTGFFKVTSTGGLSEAGPSPFDDLVSFEVIDEPGPWFKNRAGAPAPETSESLALAKPGDTIQFDMTSTSTVHTITSLIYPVDVVGGSDATNMPFDQNDAFTGGAQVTLEDPGLYVFTCKIHPYMFAGVIVDDPGTTGLDLGENIRIVNGIDTPTFSPLAVSLLRTFFVVTNPDYWQDYDDGTWNVSLNPGVPIRVSTIDAGETVVPLSLLNVNVPLVEATPQYQGIGEVWVNTQFEESAGKTKYGSATAVDTSTWEVTKKVFGTGEHAMNHPHNMWANTDNDIIYQTEWFDDELSSIDRENAVVLDNVIVGDSASHVMTRPADGDKAYVALNGDNTNTSVAVVTMDSDGNLDTLPRLDIGAPHPHGHWMNNDYMVTPNAFTGTSTIHEFATGDNTIIPASDLLAVSGNAYGVPIATKMHPNGEKYYVANLLDQTVVCVSIGNPACSIPVENDTEDGTADGLISIKHVVLVGNVPNLFTLGDLAPVPTGAAGLLPIQTPVSPDGKYVVTATLLPSITIIDTETDELVLSLACDAGCHGANFGANANGGYNAYVSSKFSNALIVFDPAEAVAADANNDGLLDSTESVGVVGKVLLSTGNMPDGLTDDTVTGLDGMGGQGVLALPNIYDGWIEETVASTTLSTEVQDWVDQLSDQQKNPYPPITP